VADVSAPVEDEGHIPLIDSPLKFDFVGEVAEMKEGSLA
jgi:hypothetical protein